MAVKTFQAGFRNADGRLIRKRFPDTEAGRKSAEQWYFQEKAKTYDVKAGIRPNFEPVTLEVALREHLATREKTGSSYVLTERHYANVILLAFPHLAQKFLHEVDQDDWEKVLGSEGFLVKDWGISHSTHNTARAFYHRLYTVNIERKVPRALVNPVAAIKRLDAKRPEIEFLETEEMVQTYLSWAFKDEKYESFGIFAMISLNTGLRVGNVLALRWGDIDFVNKRLWVRQKLDYHTGTLRDGTKSGPDSKPLGVNDALLEALTQWRARLVEKGRVLTRKDFIVCDDKGAHLNQDIIRNRHRRLLKRADMDYIKVHALRHTYAVHYLENGGNPHDLKEQLMHSSIMVTERYMHVVKSKLQNRASVVNFGAPVAGSVLTLFSGRDKKAATN